MVSRRVEETVHLWNSDFLKPDDIYEGDCRDLLPRVEPESVALSVWSPPYYVGKQYESYLKTFADWKNLLRRTIKLHFPIIRRGGFLAINAADILCFEDSFMPRIQAENVDRHKSKVTRADVLHAKEHYPEHSRYQLPEILGCSEQPIDRRLNGNNTRGGKYALQTRVKLVAGLIEAWGARAGFYLYDRRIWAKDPAWENSKWHTLSYRSVDEFEYLLIFWKPGVTTIRRNKLGAAEWTEWGSRGVWEIRSVRANDDHEAKFPIELPRRLILLLTDPGDLILDPFNGSGTTAEAAVVEGRRYMGFETAPKYAELAKRQIGQAVNCPRQMRLVAQ